MARREGWLVRASLFDGGGETYANVQVFVEGSNAIPSADEIWQLNYGAGKDKKWKVKSVHRVVLSIDDEDS